jgi:hypothetical protein
MKLSPLVMRTVGSCLLILTWGHAHAGRPLSVEDANVNETGQGHVETWWAHSSAGSRAWTVAPAWSPVDGMELTAAFSRENPGQGCANQMASDRFARPWLQLGCFAGFVANSFRKVTPLCQRLAQLPSPLMGQFSRQSGQCAGRGRFLCHHARPGLGAIPGPGHFASGKFRSATCQTHACHRFTP